MRDDTLSMSESPISAELMSSPLELQIRMVQVGGGPVLAIVPAVVNVCGCDIKISFIKKYTNNSGKFTIYTDNSLN